MVMTARATRPTDRAMWIVPALICIVTGLTPAPAHASNPPAPPAAEVPNAGGGTQTPTTTIPAPATERSECERSIAALAGDPEEAALLKTRYVQDLARGQANLLTCRAVKDDSDEACKLLGDDDAIKSCRAMRSVFHELRENPRGRGFMFNDVQFEDCQRFEPLAPYCEKFRAAARTGDATQCDTLGEFQSNCRAAIKLDKSLCTAPKSKGFQGRDHEGGETYGEDIRKDCQRQVEKMAVYAKGLLAVAESGPPLERQLAKAALQQPDACTPLADAAAKACSAKSTPPPRPSGKPTPAPLNTPPS